MISETKNRSLASARISLGNMEGPSGMFSTTHACTASTPSPVSAEMGNTVALLAFDSYQAISADSSSSSSKSTLLRRMAIGGPRQSSPGCSMSSASSGRSVTSTMASRMSASLMACCTAVIIRSSSSSLWLTMIPGVSRKTTWWPGSLQMPDTLCLVVWALAVTIDSCSPRMWFIRVDLPALGRPMMAAKPILWSVGSSSKTMSSVCARIRRAISSGVSSSSSSPESDPTT